MATCGPAKRLAVVMKKLVLLLTVLLTAASLSAKRIDYYFLHQISGTKWKLEWEKKPGIFKKKNLSLTAQTVTFSEGSLLFDLPDANYSCSYTLKNKRELWLYCTEPDQYVYRIHSLSVTQLVIDVLVKGKDGKYALRKRQSYHRVTS